MLWNRLKLIEHDILALHSTFIINANISMLNIIFSVTKYKDAKVEQPKQATPNVVSSNPLDNLDCKYFCICNDFQAAYFFCIAEWAEKT